MSRKTEILDLLRSVNPAPATDDEVTIRAEPLPPVRARSQNVRGPGRHRGGWGPAALAALLLTVTTGLAVFWSQESPGPISGLESDYGGSMIRDGGSGEPDVRHMVSIQISADHTGANGVLIHGAPGLATIDTERRVVMPVAVTVSDGKVRVHWDSSLGGYEDTTLEQCRWQEWTLTFELPDGNGHLGLIDGSVVGLPPEGPDVGEFLSGCPSGEREILSLVLVPR